MRVDSSAEARPSAEKGPEPQAVRQAQSKHLREWAFNCGTMIIAAAGIWFVSLGGDRPAVLNALIFLAFAVPIQGVFSNLAYRKDRRRSTHPPQ